MMSSHRKRSPSVQQQPVMTDSPDRMEGARAKLTDVNPHLVCVLCHGYFVDATTIAECLHSFCRSCIFRHLERKPICPICEVAVLNTKLHIALRPDKTLQDIVYKLVPGLYRNEMQRRREFYKQHPYRDDHLEPECRGVGLDRVVYSPNDLISISLEFYDDDREREEWNSNNVIQKPVPIKKSPPGSKRYLQCPASFKIKHVKKFIRQKCGLADTCEVEVIYRKESLPDNYSLMDIAYIYTWKRNEPIRLYYKLPMKMLEAAKALASHKIVKEPVPVESQGEVTKKEEATKKDDPHKKNVAEPVSSASIVATVQMDCTKNENPKKLETKCDKPVSSAPEMGSSSNSGVPIAANGLGNPATEPQFTPIPKDVPQNATPPNTEPPSPVVTPSDVITPTLPATPLATPTPTAVTSTPKSNVTASAPNPMKNIPNQINPTPLLSTPVSTVDKLNGELAAAPRTMTKQDELPVSVLLSLGNCTPEIKRQPLVDKPSQKPETKFCQILPKPEQKPVPIVDQLLTKKMMTFKTNSKSVNKIASDLAENKTSNKKTFKTPAPFSLNPLMLKTSPKGTMQRLADQAPGNRTPFHHTQLDSPGNRTPYHRPMPDPPTGNKTPFHHAQTPQHLPVYPPPMMPAMTKTVPWKEAAQSRTLFPQSPRHVPQYPFALPKEPKQSTKVKKASQDPFLFSTNEGESSKADHNERVSLNGVGNTPPTSIPSSLLSPPHVKNVSPNPDSASAPQGTQNGISNDKTERPEVTVKTSNGSLTISTELPKTNDSHEPSEIQTDKLSQPAVINKNISGQRLNGNGLITSGPNSKSKSGFENKAKMNSESKVESELKNTTTTITGKKSVSLSRKNHSANSIIPGGVVSKTGPTLDQRLQQLYKSNSRQQANGIVPAQMTQPIVTGKLPQQSRLASWLNNRFNTQNKPPSPEGDSTVKTSENKDKHGQESPTAKLGKEMSMLKKKLDELRKNSEGCEITQENPTPDAVNKIRDVTPNVSIEFMKAADMKKLENTTKTKEKAVKRPVPGLKAIQDVDVKKIKLSPEEEDAKKAKLDKKGDEALDLSGAGKPSDELAHRIALLQKNGALSNQQQFNWLLNRPLVAGQKFMPRSS